MEKLHIRKVSFLGFMVLVLAALLSGVILVSLIFRIEGIKDEQQVAESAYDGLFELKYYTERLLTTGNLDREKKIWQQTAVKFEDKLQKLEAVTGAPSEEFDNLWNVIKEEIAKIGQQLENPLFQAANTMRKSLLRRLGEGLNTNEQSEYYLALIELTNAIDYLKQYEGFLMDELQLLKNNHIREIEQRLVNTRNLAFLLPTLILVFTLWFSVMISRRIGKIEHELKAKKNELHRLNDHLQEEIEQQITELRNKDEILIVQSKQLALGEMLGNIAHQWRQPLNALGLYIQDVRDAYEFKELDGAYLKKVTDESMEIIHRMSDTIDDFRTFYAPETEKGYFSLARMIEEVRKLLEEQLRQLHICLVVGEGDATLYGYSNEFKQVLLNLINNAKDAITARIRGKEIDEGCITISVEHDGTTARITVQDDGGGIDEAIFEKIFEPYFTTKFKSQGTGIGLYMSKTIIERNMEGRIYAENVNGGAKIVIELPESVA